jgi:hypothetical protein
MKQIKYDSGGRSDGITDRSDVEVHCWDGFRLHAPYTMYYSGIQVILRVSSQTIWEAIVLL